MLEGHKTLLETVQVNNGIIRKDNEVVDDDDYKVCLL